MSLHISKTMRDRSITQFQLGKRLGVNDRTIRKWLSGRCRFDQYVGMCKELDIELSLSLPIQEITIVGNFVVIHKDGKA